MSAIGRVAAHPRRDARRIVRDRGRPRVVDRGLRRKPRHPRHRQRWWDVTFIHLRCARDTCVDGCGRGQWLEGDRGPDARRAVHRAGIGERLGRRQARGDGGPPAGRGGSSPTAWRPPRLGLIERQEHRTAGLEPESPAFDRLINVPHLAEVATSVAVVWVSPLVAWSFDAARDGRNAATRAAPAPARRLRRATRRPADHARPRAGT